MVSETTHVQEVVDSNPGAEYIFSHWFVAKNYCLFEKTENKQKEAVVGPFKKSYHKNRQSWTWFFEKFN